MGKLANNQSGFNIVEAIVVAAVVGLVGAAGWLAYQHNRTKVSNAASNSSQGNSRTATTPPPAPSPSSTSTIQIPELGIQLTVPDDLKDLTYRTSTVTLRNGNQATVAYFSTKALAAADQNCGTNFGPLGSLERTSGQYPTFTGSNPAPGAPIDYGALVKQFATFYISSGSPEAACSTSSSLPQPASGKDWKSEFVSTFSTIQATQASN